MATSTKPGIKKQEEPREVRKLRFARRTMMYIVKTLILITVAAIVCIGVFMTAERFSNLYILSMEGLSMRAGCIIADGATNDLSEYFTDGFISSDAGLTETTYDNYTVTSYDYDLTVEKISVLPWSTVATVTAVERASIKGAINADQLSEGENAADYPVPEWTTVRYRIHFINTGSRWYIAQLEPMEYNPETQPENTPDPNASPQPMATPTPVPTDEPTPIPG